MPTHLSPSSNFVVPSVSPVPPPYTPTPTHAHARTRSLLRTPELLHSCVSAMRAGVQGLNVPISVKLRSGFEDTSLFEANLLAAQVGVGRGRSAGWDSCLPSAQYHAATHVHALPWLPSRVSWGDCWVQEGCLCVESEVHSRPEALLLPCPTPLPHPTCASRRLGRRLSPYIRALSGSAIVGEPTGS